MADQVTESLFFSYSYAGRGIVVDSSDDAAWTTIHTMPSAYENHQQAVFMEVHNNSGDRVPFAVIWNPHTGEDGDSNPATLYFEAPPYGDVIVSNGLRIGRYTYGPGQEPQGHIGIWVQSASDEDKLVVRGYVVDLQQPGVPQ